MRVMYKPAGDQLLNIVHKYVQVDESYDTQVQSSLQQHHFLEGHWILL